MPLYCTRQLCTCDNSGSLPSVILSAAFAGLHKQTDAPTERAIIHLDMDCFFAAVAAVGRPEFHGKPLAVCHSNSAQGSGEVSSANYEARAFGVGAGMFIAEAKKRCPGLVVVPYEFDKYQHISEQVYRILMRYTGCVQPLSCDEAYLDVTGLGDPEDIARRIRSDIVTTTGCTASAGIGPNVLLARLATKKGKPNGQCRVRMHQALEFLGDLPVEELPGETDGCADADDGRGKPGVAAIPDCLV